MSVATASPFEAGWDEIKKIHPQYMQAIRALEAGGPMPPYMTVAGNKNAPLYRNLNQNLYSRMNRVLPRRVVEPFMGNLGISLNLLPEEGLFASDKDWLLPALGEAIKERPEKIEFDPRKLTVGLGEEIPMYADPSKRNFEPTVTLPELTRRDLDEAERIMPGSVIDERVALPAAGWKLRNDINRGIDAYQRGELSKRGLDQLLADVLGYSKIGFKSIWRTGSDGMVNIPPGGRDNETTALSASERASDYLEDLTGKRNFGRTKIGGGNTYRPQLVPGGDFEPWNVEPWSAVMDNWFFQQGSTDFDDMLSDAVRMRSSPRSGDAFFLDSPYGEEAGQHQWSNEQNERVYDWMKYFKDQGLPAVAYNSAAPSTIDAIRSRGLPLSLILSRAEKLAAGVGKKGKATIKPESVVAVNVPGYEDIDLSEFYRTDIEPNTVRTIDRGASKKGSPAYKFTTSFGDAGIPKQVSRPVNTLIDNLIEAGIMTPKQAATAQRRGKLGSITDPESGVRSWLVNYPEALEQIYGQPAYRKQKGRTVA